MVELRRDFYLPDEDTQFLDLECQKWEAIQDGKTRAVVWYGFPFPEVFQPNDIDLKIKIPNDYASGAALDMFFTNVNVTRKDGIEIPRLTRAEQFDGQQWWQWSRHYPKSVPWRPDVNNLVTHLCHVQNILDQEAKGKKWN